MAFNLWTTWKQLADMEEWDLEYKKKIVMDMNE